MLVDIVMNDFWYALRQAQLNQDLLKFAQILEKLSKKELEEILRKDNHYLLQIVENDNWVEGELYLLQFYSGDMLDEKALIDEVQSFKDKNSLKTPSVERVTAAFSSQNILKLKPLMEGVAKYLLTEQCRIGNINYVRSILEVKNFRDLLMGISRDEVGNHFYTEVLLDSYKREKFAIVELLIEFGSPEILHGRKIAPTLTSLIGGDSEDSQIGKIGIITKLLQTYTNPILLKETISKAIGYYSYWKAPKSIPMLKILFSFYAKALQDISGLVPTTESVLEDIRANDKNFATQEQNRKVRITQMIHEIIINLQNSNAATLYILTRFLGNFLQPKETPQHTFFMTMLNWIYDYLNPQSKPQKESQHIQRENSIRFFKLVTRLPPELQMQLCNKAYERPQLFILPTHLKEEGSRAVNALN